MHDDDDEEGELVRGEEDDEEEEDDHREDALEGKRLGRLGDTAGGDDEVSATSSLARERLGRWKRRTEATP